MTKKDRQTVFDKYGGRCAYCGCELLKGWHVDELEPCRREWKHEYNSITGKTSRKITGYTHPERLNTNNQMPSCPSCNINKHSDSLEQFRANISAYMKYLNKLNTQYKMAKKYGLVVETEKPVTFYFETQTPNP